MEEWFSTKVIEYLKDANEIKKERDAWKSTIRCASCSLFFYTITGEFKRAYAVCEGCKYVYCKKCMKTKNKCYDCNY